MTFNKKEKLIHNVSRETLLIKSKIIKYIIIIKKNKNKFKKIRKIYVSRETYTCIYQKNMINYLCATNIL